MMRESTERITLFKKLKKGEVVLARGLCNTSMIDGIIGIPKL